MVSFSMPSKEPPMHIEQKDGFFGTEKNLLPPAHSGHCNDYVIPTGFCILGNRFSEANIKNMQMLECLQISKDMQNISLLLKSARKHYLCCYSATTKILV
jgi:hypothetical protein